MKTSDVLSLAINKEIEAHNLYTNVAQRMDNPAAKTLLEELAAEEAKHRSILEGLSSERLWALDLPPPGRDLKIAEYLEAKPMGPESSLQEVLIHAVKREEQARDFYETMSVNVETGELQTLFEKLAAMESSHKARLEEFYDDVFLSEF